MAAEGNSDGGWPGGWLIAVVAGVIAAILARWLGDVGMAAAVLVGIFVFLVFGVLLGMFWAAPATVGTGDHGPADSHAGHGHEAVAGAAPAGSPIVAVPVPTPVLAVEPAPVAAPAASDGAAVKPAALAAPRDGVGDKLQTIEGIGPALEKLCQEMGIFHFDQIAGWGVGEVAWMDSNLKGFKGRVTRDKWVRQSKLIGEVGIDEFLRRAKTNDY